MEQRLPFPEPGIYTGLPEDDYHSIPAFSKSLVKKFMISPIDAWEALYSEEEEERMEAFDYGSALHCLLLEGRDAFESRYCKAFDKADHPDALDTVADLRACLDKHGSSYPKSAPKPSLIHLIQSLHPEEQILDVLRVQHQDANDGKTEISAKAFAEIVSREWIRQLSFLADMQASEVSFFWIDPHFHIPCKARLDAIAFRRRGAGIEALIGDIKTFSNSHQKPVIEAVHYNIAAFRYHIDAVFYARALEKTPRIFHGSPETKWPDFKGIGFEFLFVEKGRPFPNVIPREFDASESGVTREAGLAAQAHIQRAANAYRDLHEEFGTKPWNRPHPLETVGDSDLPPYLL